MRSVSIILPVYNGEKYLKNLNDAIRSQDYDGQIEIITPVSKSKDNSMLLCEEFFDIVYEVIDFNHAMTRHEAAQKASGEVLVFITQDIIPSNKFWLKELVAGLGGDIVATYSRQIPHEDATITESIIRQYNYPSYERLCNKQSREKWGRKNIYYSDSSSATTRDYFFQMNGYKFTTMTNEDVIYVDKVIKSGKSVLYNPKSKVNHSHNFLIKDTFNRYKLIGQFEAENPEIFNNYNSNGEGFKLIRYVMKHLYIKKAYFSLLSFIIVECPVKLVGYKLGFYRMLMSRKDGRI